jgi:hypothetical protein
VIALPPLEVGNCQARVRPIVLTSLIATLLGAVGAIAEVEIEPAKFSLAPTLLIAVTRTW